MKKKTCKHCGMASPRRTICDDCVCECGRLKMLCECPVGTKRSEARDKRFQTKAEEEMARLRETMKAVSENRKAKE